MHWLRESLGESAPHILGAYSSSVSSTCFDIRAGLLDQAVTRSWTATIGVSKVRASSVAYLETHGPTTTQAADGKVEMADLETCSKCGAAVADTYRHQRWHEKSDDELSSLQRTVRDLETSTKRSLQQFEAAVRRPH